MCNWMLKQFATLKSCLIVSSVSSIRSSNISKSSKTNCNKLKGVNRPPFLTGVIMRVTIISDASFCPNTKAAGYGGWVVCNRGNNANGGPLRGAPDSGAAETMAICNIIWEGMKAKLIHPGDH